MFGSISVVPIGPVCFLCSVGVVHATSPLFAMYFDHHTLLSTVTFMLLFLNKTL